MEEEKKPESKIAEVSLDEANVEEKAVAPALPPRKEEEESWEEKTWRELIKVREDLFWKRIGVKGEE